MLETSCHPENSVSNLNLNLVFVDPTVPDYQRLIGGVAAGTQVVLLDPSLDGVVQISQIISENTNISSIHIVSHGDAGFLQLGASHLGLDNLSNYAGELQNWKSALTPDADILLYGCNVANGETGTNFVQELSQLTSADVAASDDLTGNPALGADWELEVKTGAIEAPLLFQSEVIEAYNSVLATANSLGKVEFAKDYTYAGTTVGGLSGITYDPINNQLYAISDAKNDGNGPVRFYTLNIDLSSGSLSPSGVTFTGMTLLRNADGTQFSGSVSDTEGIAFTSSGNVFVSSEGMFSTNTQQFIDRFNISTGNRNQSLPIPSPKYDVSADTSYGIRNNKGFESLTVTPDGQYLFTATEVALEQDSDLSTGGPSRIVKYNLSTNSVEAEFVYNSDSGNGLSDLLALDGNTLLAIDRNTSNGFGNLYQVSLQSATDIKNNNSLIASGLGGITAVQKTLVRDLLGFGLGTNFEGMTFGPTLPNGKRSLILVTDNNFGSSGSLNNIPTRFAAFEFTPDTVSNTPPIIDLNGAASGTGYSATFNRGSGATAIVDTNNLTVTDDSANINSATVTIANLQNGAAELLSAITSGTNIISNYNNGVLTLSGSDTLAKYQQVLRSVTYNNTSIIPDTTSRTINFSINDGLADSNVATTTLSINSPTISMGNITGIGYRPPIASVNDSQSDRIYAFSISNNTRLVAELTNAGGNADLALYDFNGNLLSFSTNGSTLSERIDYSTLGAGNYYLRVYQAFAGQSVSYRLRVSAMNV